MNEQIEKQAIEEMAKDICHLTVSCEECTVLARKTWQSKERYCKAMQYAKRAVGKGYRKQEWISVEERLPDIDGKYLVYTKQGFIHIMHYHASGAFGFEAWNVTHWMPLPEAPKGGAE